MNKRILVAAVALVLVASVSVAVYFSFKSNDVFSQLDDEDTSQEALEETKLTFYFQGNEPGDTKEVLEQVEEKSKNRLKANLDFKFIQNSEDYLGEIRSIIASGQPCDAFFFSDYFPQGLRNLVREDVIKDITGLFPKYAPSYYKYFSSEELRTATVEGKIYAIPNHMPTAQTLSAIVRTDLMEKYGIPEIKNYEDFEVYLKAVKQNQPEVIPMTFYESVMGLFSWINGYVMLDYSQGLVYRQDDPGMKVIAWESTSEFKKGIETIRRWYKEGYLSNGSIRPIDEASISSGSFASFISTYDAEYQYNTMLKNRQIEWRYKAYPLSDKISLRNSPLNGAMLINSKSDNTERVLMFVEWLQSNQENYDSLMYGIKDKHYTLADNWLKLPDNVDAGELSLSWAWRWPFTNIDYERPDSKSAEDYKKAYIDLINTKTQYPRHLGFVADFSPVRDLVDFRRSAFFSMEQNIHAGYLTPEDIDTYIKDQKSEGIGTIIAEVQSQLDKWASENKSNDQ
ncbi:MAG: extracellular solute-binding protein [Clostridia bacterium]|nr:extracellular solute-binding protein [Clostridia bacterium]